MSKIKKGKSGKGLKGKFNPEYALSGSWNTRRSEVHAIDLANTQESIQDFIEVLLPGEQYRVVWKGSKEIEGQTDTKNRVIELSYEPLAKTKKGQIPDKLVDVVMGVGVHESGHAPFKEIRDQVASQIKDVDPSVKNTLEDVYIDYGRVKEHPVVGAYIRRGRDYAKETRNLPEMIEGRMQIPVALQLQDMIGMWQCVMLYGIDVIPMLQKRPFDDREIAEECLRRLLKIGVEAIGTLQTPSNYARLNRSAQGAINTFLDHMQDLQDQQQQEEQTEQDEATQGFQDGEYEVDDGEDEEQEQEDQEEQGEVEGDQPTPGKGGDEDEDSDDDGSAEGEEGDETSEDEEGETEEQEGEGGEDEGEESEAGGDEQGKDEQESSSSPTEGDGEAGEDGQAGDETSQSPPRLDHGTDQESGGLGEFDLGEIKSCMALTEGNDELPAELADEVFEASERKMEEIGHKYNVGKWIKELPDPGGMDTQYAELGKEVKAAFESREHMATLRYPFQEHGRISMRTLPRLFLGKPDLFEEVEQEDDLDLCLCLLFDMSASMRPEQIQICKAAISATIEGFQGDDTTDLWVWGYGQRLYRMYEPGWPAARFGGSKGIPVGYSTPTLPSMVEMVEAISKTPSIARKDKMMISFTDGGANMGGSPLDVRKKVAELEDHGWVIIGAGIGQSARVEVGEGYDPAHSFYLNRNLSDLPDALREIVKDL